MAKNKKTFINMDDDVRINKYLSDSGICSRRGADEIITQGLVEIDGVVAKLGDKVKKNQTVKYKGEALKRNADQVLLMINKPRGIVCTTDMREKDNIVNYVNYPERIFPIGRLDKDSSGLLLLTNDGDIVNKILRSRNQHEKEYIVKVNKEITESFLEKMGGGVKILGVVTKKCKIEKISKFVFRIVLTQGLNRQIRRMCEVLDYKVMELERIRIMNLHLGRLRVGDYRKLTFKEMSTLNSLLEDSKKEYL